MKRRVIGRVPLNISSLIACAKKYKCLPSKVHLFTHVFTACWFSSVVLCYWKMAIETYKEETCGLWSDALLAKSISRTVVKCFLVNTSYVMVKRRDNITDYLEDLVNYGYNKITYIENLRSRGLLWCVHSLSGYRFVIAGKMFAFDLPHLP